MFLQGYYCECILCSELAESADAYKCTWLLVVEEFLSLFKMLSQFSEYM